MNFRMLTSRSSSDDHGHVDPHPPQTYRPNPPTNSPPTTDSQVTVVHDPRPQPMPDAQAHAHARSEPPSPLSQGTVIPYMYAPTPPLAPSPPSIPSELEVYGPDRHRLFGHSPAVTDDARRIPLTPSPAVHFDRPHLMMADARDPLLLRDFKDELTRAAGIVTPGVDDGPYIRYALDALSRPVVDSRGVSENPSSDGDQPYLPAQQHSVSQPTTRLFHPIPFHQPPETIGIDETQSSAEEQLQARRQRRQETKDVLPEEPQELPHDYHVNVEDLPPLVSPVQASPPRAVDLWQAQPDEYQRDDPEKATHHAPPLTFKPWILRPQSLLLLTTLCFLMIAALVFCAVFSVGRNGFTAYSGSIYGGQYFLFRILPQLLGAILLLYSQCLVTTAFRVLPFSAMASDDRRQRRNAVFLPLYPKSFLWPQLNGSWSVWIPALNAWFMNLTIPLQSSLFTVVLVDGTWTWSTVQGVAWTLVALYVSLLLSIIVMFVFWRQRRTGLMEGWDLRTLADIIFLVSQSNSLPQYRGLESVATRKDMKRDLNGNSERLGYWVTPEEPENYTFYGIGVPTTAEDLEVEKLDNVAWADRRKHRPSSSDADGRPAQPDVRTRYLPWCFRDSQVILFVVAASILLIALIVVSFIRSTDLRDGFLPGLSAGPMAGAFSAANFLYSFLPSLVGLLLFLVFQSLDLTLRILTPWGELSRPEGSRAQSSLLLDYSACLPWESTYKAIKHKHWRVAFVTFLSPLFVLLPVLGGGLFMALTPPTGRVRMYPNVPAFAIILTLLVFYLAALVSLVPYRKQFRLPHAVTCLAEIISFCCNEQLRTDKAFDFYRVGGRHDLMTQLDCGKDWHRQGRWTFGAGRNNDERLGIKRLSLYTVNPRQVRQYDRRVKGQQVSSPLPRGSSSLFNR